MKINSINNTFNHNKNVAFQAKFDKRSLETIIKTLNKTNGEDLPQLYTMVKHLENVNSEDILLIRQGAWTNPDCPPRNYYSIRTLNGKTLSSSSESWFNALKKAIVENFNKNKMSYDTFDKLAYTNKNKTAKDIIEMGIDNKKLPDNYLSFINE